MKQSFSRFGITDEIFSDNGQPYNSKDICNFAKDRKFVHNTSSLKFPCSNGLAESGVKVVKQILRKSHHFIEDIS